MGQRIEYKTDEGIRIVGNWVSAPTTIAAAILVHSYPSTKEIWSSFQMVLAQRGIASLAIDLRGHGESRTDANGNPTDYRAFTDEETISSMSDLRGAYEWIRDRGIDEDTIVAVGSSIGANLVLHLLSETPTMPAAVLLSPGINYHGVDISDVIENVSEEQSVWFSASSGDDDESVKACQKLDQEFVIKKKTYVSLKNVGHGTAIIEGDEVLMGQIADWLRDRIHEFDLSVR